MAKSKTSTKPSKNGWKATANVTLKVSLVSAEGVKMYSAIDSSSKINLHLLHKDCNHRVAQKYLCPDCTKEILDKNTELIHGYDNGDGKWIVLSDAEIESCKKDSNGILDVFQFVELGEVKPILYNKPNYLEAGEKMPELFGLIYQGIAENGVAGLAKLVSRQKDHFYVVTPLDGVLAAFELHFPNEIRSAALIEKPITNGVDADALKMFTMIVKKMTRPYDEKIIKDDYTEALRALVTAKASGQVIDLNQRQVAKQAMSLKDMLAQSLAAA